MMKTNKLLLMLTTGLSLAIAVSCSEQTIASAQMRQNIIDDAMKQENYSDLKQDLAFLESQGLLQPDSFYNLLQENITESDDATFDEVIEKAQGLLTKHMRNPFLLTLVRATEENKPVDYYVDAVANPLFSYVVQRKDHDIALHNIVRGWLRAWGNKKYIDGSTPLHIAAEKGHMEIIKFLLAAGVSVDIQMPNGATALYFAAQNGYTEIVRLLIQGGANVDIQRTDNGYTALCIAAEKGHLEIVRFLVEHGADVNMKKNVNGATSLYLAAEKGHIEIVKFLLAAGASVDMQMDNEATSLYIAAQNGYTGIVRLLIEGGANVNIQIIEGSTPLHIAALYGHAEIVRILLAAGANVNAQRTTNGITPLVIASIKGYAEIVQLLLAANVNLDIRSYNGKLAEEVAKTSKIKGLFARARKKQQEQKNAREMVIFENQIKKDLR
ncbi:ankyrin repeat domain-containing protein [Candidatus Chromulinivorax destructor]|nr:ankyrin repeat domain-containing protein [Candidatus Chromulinivorax destructor]